MIKLIKNIKSYSCLLFIIFTLISCEYGSFQVSESEINLASSWNENDQLPSFPICESFDSNDQLNCFKNKIEFEMNNYLQDKVFPIDTLQYILTLKIDTIGNFSLFKLEPLDKLNKESLLLIEQAITRIPKALPAIKTNVGEFVEVTFNLPFRLNYE